MSYSLIRVDDRLIHGQLMVWQNQLKPKNIHVVDDEVAADQFQKELLESPVGLAAKVRVLSASAAKPVIAATNEQANADSFLIVRTPLTLKALLPEIIGLPIVIGPVGANDTRSAVYRSIYLSQAEQLALTELAELGSEISFQFLPTEQPQKFLPIQQPTKKSQVN